jgi:hypothetical protein
VWGRAPSQACPERSRRVQAERSSAAFQPPKAKAPQPVPAVGLESQYKH